MYTHLAAEILEGYYLLESLRKDFVVNMYYSPKKVFKTATYLGYQGRHDLWIK